MKSVSTCCCPSTLADGCSEQRWTLSAQNVVNVQVLPKYPNRMQPGKVVTQPESYSLLLYIWCVLARLRFADLLSTLQV